MADLTDAARRRASRSSRRMYVESIIAARSSAFPKRTRPASVSTTMVRMPESETTSAARRRDSSADE